MTRTMRFSRVPAIMLLAACAAATLPPQAEAANANGWRAAQVEGEAHVQGETGAATPLREGASYPYGRMLETGPKGRVVLTRGPSSVTIGAASRMKIPEVEDPAGRTKVIQMLGSLLFKVEKRAAEHFEVETPYLAAVVKGTTFTVSVDNETSAVHVVGGAVQVTALSSGEVGLLKPGLTAVVSSRRSAGLTILGAQGANAGPRAASNAAEDTAVNDEAASADDGSGTQGRSGRLRVMIGEPAVDVAESSKGFVKNAASAGGSVHRTSAKAGHGNGNGNSGGGNGNGNPGGGNAYGHGNGNGNPGGGNAYGQGNGNAYGHNKNNNGKGKKNKKK